MKLIIKIIIFLIIIILISNFIPHVQIGERFLYMTENQEYFFECIPSKGTTLKQMEKSFKSAKQRNPKLKNKKLYRTFKKDYWKFWNWRRYLMNPLYKYPYMDFSVKTNKESNE